MSKQEEINNCLLYLKRYRNKLNRQEVKTISGQIKAGQCAEAIKGLNRIIERRCAHG